MQATVQVEQRLPDGSHTIGTGFLVDDPTPDGVPRTVLVTANHVLNRMPAHRAHVGYRVQGKDGGWRYEPEPHRHPRRRAASFGPDQPRPRCGGDRVKRAGRPSPGRRSR